MNILKILGSLPASNSATGVLNLVDWQKIIRMGIIVFVSAFITSFGASSSLTLSAAIVAASHSGVAALSAATVEAIRRFVVNNVTAA